VDKKESDLRELVSTIEKLDRIEKNVPSGEQAMGCFAAIWSICVITPMWLMLMFSMLNALGDKATTWMWVLYWVYSPACVLGVIFVATARFARGK